MKYVAPSFEEASLGALKTIVSTLETAFVLLLLLGSAQLIRRLGERFGRNKLQIADFIDATGEGGALAFAEQLRYAMRPFRSIITLVIHFVWVRSTRCSS